MFVLGQRERRRKRAVAARLGCCLCLPRLLFGSLFLFLGRIWEFFWSSIPTGTDFSYACNTWVRHGFFSFVHRRHEAHGECLVGWKGLALWVDDANAFEGRDMCTVSAFFLQIVYFDCFVLRFTIAGFHCGLWGVEEGSRVSKVSLDT